MELYILNIEEAIEAAEYQRLFDFVTPEKKERISRFRYDNDKKRSLYGNVLARYLISRRLHIDNKDIVFEVNAYGKPYLAGNKELFFNISHSGKWIFCGLAEKEIGVDIEHRGDCKEDLAKRFFSQEEYMYLMDTPEEKWQQAFYDIWSLKESYIKYKGLGLSMPLNSFAFHFEGDTVSLHTAAEEEEQPFVKRYTFDPEYSMAVCSVEPPSNYIIRIPLQILANWGK